LWAGIDSSFIQRLIGLTTTHFGMSTPIINEERQARAMQILGAAAERAEEAERRAVRAWKSQSPKTAGAVLYDFELTAVSQARNLPVPSGRVAVRLPVILPPEVKKVRVEDGMGKTVPAALTGITDQIDGRTRADVRFVTALGADSSPRFLIHPAPDSANFATPVTRLKNEWLDVVFSAENGIESFTHLGTQIGGADFLRPFISYKTHARPLAYPAGRFTFLPLANETWDGLQRVRLKTSIVMATPQGEHTSDLTFTFTLFDQLPYLYVDAEIDYACIPPTDLIHNMMQKLRRLIDLRWVEVAPFQLTPKLEPAAGQALRIWKHNYMGVTAYYDLNYGAINPRNRELDAFNHQVTAGWVAVSDGRRGLLVGEDAEALASMAFCPMRLREREGRQVISLNPFGSYHGRMLDYSHLGGSGVGAALQGAFGGQLNPNAPSYNGQTQRFSLLLAPYAGDEPPASLQAESGLHFYPPEILVHSAPQDVVADTAADIRHRWQVEERRAKQARQTQLDPPTAFWANPVSEAVVLVWDEPRGQVVGGYEAAWRTVEGREWAMVTTQNATRMQIADLTDGQSYVFKVRAVCADPAGGDLLRSAWTEERTCVPGAVTPSPVGAVRSRLPFKALARMIFSSLGSVIRVRLAKEKQV